jgi:hypothetical protein
MSKDENQTMNPQKKYISSFLFAVNNTPGSFLKSWEDLLQIM